MIKTIQRGYKTELKPNRTQRKHLAKCCGVARFTWNWALTRRIEAYRKTGTSPNAIKQHRELNKLKKTEFPWMYEVSKTIPQEVLRNLDQAFRNFFNYLKKKKAGLRLPKVSFPRFKSRKKGLGSFRIWGAIHVGQDRIKLPRIGWIRLKEKGYLPVDGTQGIKILFATVSERAGRWYVSLQVEQEIRVEEATGDPISCDLGINRMATLSNGERIKNPKPLAGNLCKMRRLQRKLSRQKRGSKRRERTRRKVAGAHLQIANIRLDALHKATTRLVAKAKSPEERPWAIGIEDLGVLGMLKNRKLSRAIADVGMGEFARQLAYKCEWYGVDLFKVDRFFPSSKRCSDCGRIKEDFSLSESLYCCECCGLVIDRDLNAALNILKLLLAESSSERINGRGGDVRPADISGQTPVKRQLKSVG